MASNTHEIISAIRTNMIGWLLKRLVTLVILVNRKTSFVCRPLLLNQSLFMVICIFFGIISPTIRSLVILKF